MATTTPSAASNSESVEDVAEQQFPINSFFGPSAFLTPTNSFMGQFLATQPAEQS